MEESTIRVPTSVKNQALATTQTVGGNTLKSVTATLLRAYAKNPGQMLQLANAVLFDLPLDGTHVNANSQAVVTVASPDFDAQGLGGFELLQQNMQGS